MSRVLTLNTMYQKKFTTLELTGVFADVFDAPEDTGAWLIYGSEKHGKTSWALLLSQEIAANYKVLYVSAEEGLGKDFVDNCQRMNLDASNRNLQFTDYISMQDLQNKLDKKRAPKVVVIDNVTVYKDELAYGGLRKLLNNNPSTLFIFLAHEERNEPYTATAKLIRKLAKVIMRVEGLAVTITGRVPGGNIAINEEKAQLFHSTVITEKAE